MIRRGHNGRRTPFSSVTRAGKGTRRKGATSASVGRRMNIDVEWLRKVCLSLPHTTEQIQWGSDLLFKVHGKMFAVTPLEPASVCLSFKCSDEAFAELTERPGVIPAPYLARDKWVALEAGDAIVREKLAELLHGSYELVLAR